jgi:hypothetical protein
VVGFITREKTLQGRIAALSGLDQTPLALYFQNEPLLRIFGGPPNVDFSLPFTGILRTADLDRMVVSGSHNGVFQLLMSRDGIEENELIRRYRNSLLLIIAIIFMLLCAAGIYLAFNNYKPIKRLMTSIKDDPRQQERGDELKNIERIFKKIQQEEFKNHHFIQGQLNNLKRQMVDIILEGGYNNAVQSKAWEMGIVLEGPYYNILAVRIENDPANKYDEADIWNVIENIQCPGVTFYCGALGSDSTVSLLLDLYEAPSLRDTAVRYLYEECKSRGLNLTIGAGPVIKNFFRISEALLDAHGTLQKAIAGGTDIAYSEGDEPQWILKGEHWVEKLAETLKKRDIGEAASLLEEITSYLNTRPEAPVSQK